MNGWAPGAGRDPVSKVRWKVVEEGSWLQPAACTGTNAHTHTPHINHTYIQRCGGRYWPTGYIRSCLAGWSPPGPHHGPHHSMFLHLYCSTHIFCLIHFISSLPHNFIVIDHQTANRNFSIFKCFFGLKHKMEISEVMCNVWKGRGVMRADVWIVTKTNMPALSLLKSGAIVLVLCSAVFSSRCLC